MLGDDRRGDTAAGGEGAGDGHALGCAGFDQVVEDLVGGGFVKNALVPVGQQVILQRLQFDAAFGRRVFNDDLAEVRQAGLGAHRRELGAAFQTSTDGTGASGKDDPIYLARPGSRGAYLRQSHHYL